MRVRVFWLIVPAMALVSLFASCENADGHIEFMQDELSKPGFGAEVQVTPASVILVKGGRQKFTVEGTGKVNWTVSGAKNAGTSIDGTGLLTTSPDEGAQRLTVVVTAGGNKSGRAYVYLVEPGEKNGITVRPGIIALGPGETQTFEADYSGNGGLDWAVLDAASSTVTQSGELTVDAGETAEEFSVKASLTGNGGVNGTARITVLGSGENPLPINNGIQVAPQAKNVAKGRTATFKALAFNETSGAFEELTDGVSWHLFGGAAGSLIDVNSGGLAVSENETANHLTVRARMTNDSACYGTAVVTVIGDGGQDVGGEGGGGQEGGNNSTPITFIGLTANGAEYTEATTELGLEFSAGINGLSADDITITPAGAAVKGLVSGSGGIYSLGLSGVNEETEIEVAVAKEGYAVTPSSKTVTVHGVAALLTFDSLTANGAANTATTTELTLGFSAAIDGLSADDITITPAGAAVKGTLSGKNGIYMLGVDGISAETEISVAVSKAGHVFTPSSKTVTAHFSSSNFANKARTFESLTANDAPTTTELTLEFNGAIDGLSADDITITPEDAVVKGTLSGSNGTYRLGISAVLSQEQETEISVGVSRAGYTIDPSSKTVTVYRAFASVSFTGLTANGAANAATTTELTLSFSAEIDGLSAGNISIAPAGAVVKGSLSGSGGTYRLSLSGVSAEREIEVAVAKAGYTITPSSKTVTVHKTPVAVSFTALTANGSGNTATTELTFQFSAAIDGLSADDITITPSNAAVKGTLGGSNGTYTLGVSGIISTDAETEISVGVSKAGYTINPSSKTVTVRRVPVVVSFTGLTVNGAANTATTTALTLGFSAGISGLSADDITITPAGALTKGALGGSGGTYTLAVSGISAETQINVAVSRAGYAITPSSRTVTVHKESVPVSFNSLTANGAANTTTTTALTLGFSAGISGLSADDITITPAGALTKGALGGSGGTYTLAVSGISAETEITVAVSKTGYTITPSSKTVTVHKTPVAVSFDTLTANGAANTTATTELTLGFSAAISGLSAGNITITPAGAVVKGPVSGSGGTYKLSLSGVSAESEIEVTVAKSGYTITPSSKTVAVHKAPVPVSFTGLTANGAANTTTTTELTLGFSAAISGLSADDITIMPEGAVTKGALGGSGGTYTLGVSGINGETGISVAVSRTGYNITPSSKTVTVHKEAIPVSFTALTANGRANMSSTTKLRLSFSAEIDGFSASNISITPDGAVTKGELSGSGGTYELAVSGISADTEIEVAIIKAGYNVTPSSKTLTVYYVSPNAPWVEDGPGRFVAVSLSNKIAWSSNGGQTWNEISTTRPYSSVAYGDGVFIALPYYSQSAPVQIGGSVAARSTDGGTTWHTVSLPSLVNDALLMEELSKREAVGLVGPLLPKFWKSVAYGNGMFVAVARNSRQAAWSDDGGQSWTAVTMPVDGHFGQESGWKSVTYGNGVFVAVGGHLDWYSAGGNQRGVAAVSADGKTWTRIPYKNAQNEVVGVQDHIAWESVSYGDGVFIAAGGVRAMDAMPYLNNRIARSINGGQNWSSVLLDTIDINDQTAATVNRSAFWMSIAYGDGAFVMVPDASESIEAARPQLPALWSNDNGLTWYRNNNVSSKLPHNSWQSICYGNGRFLTVAKDNRVAWSDDGGRTWEISESMQSENWTCVAYGEP